MDAMFDACAFAILIAGQFLGVVCLAVRHDERHFADWPMPFDG